jgi:hypothetical protein
MVRGSESGHMLGQVEWTHGSARVSEPRSDCSAGKARSRGLVGSPDAVFAAAAVVMVAMEDYDEDEGSQEKAA